MRHAILVPALLAAGCMAEAPVSTPEGEAQIAAALAGRTAGAPLECVSSRDIRGPRIVGGALIFDTGGSTVYLNRASGGCALFDEGRAVRTRTTTGRLCRGEIVTIFDPVSGTEFGGCTLGQFVPYSR